MGFKTIREIAQSIDDDGKTWQSFFHKTGGPSGIGAGRWADMSMGAGTPKYNAYVGVQFAATPLINQGNDGIYLGPTPNAGEKKFLHEIQLGSNGATLAPSMWVLQDYLMHYPLIDGDDTAQQVMDNTATLPRYQDGNGVMCMLVCTTPITSNANCQIVYKNSSLVSGRVSNFQINASGVVGCILSTTNQSGSNNSRSPFIPLDNGDTGIKEIESVTLQSGAGGFFALVLVKPLESLNLRENNVVTEINQLIHRANTPEIPDGSYLNFIYCPLGAASSAVPLRGYLQFVWR